MTQQKHNSHIEECTNNERKFTNCEKIGIFFCILFYSSIISVFLFIFVLIGPDNRYPNKKTINLNTYDQSLVQDISHTNSIEISTDHYTEDIVLFFVYPSTQKVKQYNSYDTTFIPKYNGQYYIKPYIKYYDSQTLVNITVPLEYELIVNDEFQIVNSQDNVSSFYYFHFEPNVYEFVFYNPDQTNELLTVYFDEEFIAYNSSQNVLCYMNTYNNKCDYTNSPKKLDFPDFKTPNTNTLLYAQIVDPQKQIYPETYNIDFQKTNNNWFARRAARFFTYCAFIFISIAILGACFINVLGFKTDLPLY